MSATTLISLPLPSSGLNYDYQSGREALSSQLIEYQSLPDDWDGYGGKAASIEAVMDSVHFLTRFPSMFPLPKPMISGSGVIGLYWEGNGCYASIGFDGSGYYCYIADCADEENGGDKVPVTQTLELSRLTYY